jgi:hypothetical protein
MKKKNVEDSSNNRPRKWRHVSQGKHFTFEDSADFLERK